MADFACPDCGGPLNYGVAVEWADGTTGVYACPPCGLTFEDRGGRAVYRDDLAWSEDPG